MLKSFVKKPGILVELGAIFRFYFGHVMNITQKPIFSEEIRRTFAVRFFSA